MSCIYIIYDETSEMVCGEMSCDSLALLCIYITCPTDLASVFVVFLWSIVNLITFQAFKVLYASVNAV